MDSKEHKRQALLWLEALRERIEQEPDAEFNPKLRDAENSIRAMAMRFGVPLA